MLAAVVTMAAGIALAGPWTPVGPADALDPIIATHPDAGAQALIVAGVPSGRTTYFTSSNGFLWEPHARPGGGGTPFLAGTPTIVYLADIGLVQRSNDQGRVFFPITLPVPPSGSLYALGGVNPSNPDELVAWAGTTVSQSLDGGATWASSPAPGPIGSLVVDWGTRRIYANLGQLIGFRPLDAPAAWGVGGGQSSLHIAGHGVVLSQSPAGGIFRSIDGGAFYTPVGETLGPLDPLCAFAFSRAPATRVHALECSTGRLLRSDDDGATWAFAASVPLEYDPLGSLAVDAANADRIYVGSRKGVFLSVDGGATVNLLSRNNTAPGSERELILDGLDSARQWVSGVTEGYFRTIDGGANWAFVDSAFRPIAASRDRTATLFGFSGEGGFQFNRTFAVSTDGGTAWTEKFVRPPSTTFGPVAYGRALGEVYLNVTRRGGGTIPSVREVNVSVDDGENWSSRFAPPIWVNAMAATQVGSAALYAGGEPLDAGAPQLFRTTDGAVTWQPVATFSAPLSSFGGTFGNTLTALAIDRNNPLRLYAGFAFPDYMMRSEDGGATWTRITSGLGAGPVTSIAFDAVSASTLYVSQSGSGVFRSTDLGATWNAMDAGLGDEVVSKVQADTFTADRLYASTGSGAYRTDLSTGVPAGWRRAIEFYHAQFNHYFVSADNDEVAGLDAGVFQGWSRTGEAFRVTEATTPGSEPVCRFFSTGFAPLSTHFYTPYPQECEGLKTNPAWFYERIAFGLMLPDAPPSRGCRAGTRALYRLWNRNLDGAPNHRYTTNPFTFGTMQNQGWLYEGEFPTRVFACVPY
ncbi:MAG TPA: hypothetical protein VII68_01450 [Casimicrobiaceae bacterium]